MKCPECQAWTFVLQTRQRQDNTKARRYECANAHRFSTTEQVNKANTCKQQEQRRSHE